MKKQQNLKSEARNTAIALIGICFAIIMINR